MNKVNIHEAKATLSELIEAAAGGQRVVICKRNRPVAELVALDTARPRARLVGGVPGLDVPEAFFAPLPDDVLDGFDEGVRHPMPAEDRALAAEAHALPAAGAPPAGRRRRATAAGR